MAAPCCHPKAKLILSWLSRIKQRSPGTFGRSDQEQRESEAMEFYQFIFWEATKALALIFLGLLAAKAVLMQRPSPGIPTAGAARYALLGLLIPGVACGAVILGNDIAAENYYWASGHDQDSGNREQAYSNALRAVNLRPGRLPYWQQLERTKFALRQYDSVLADTPALAALSAEQLGEEDRLRIADCYYNLGQPALAIAQTRAVIQHHPSYAFAYLLQGASLLSLRRYADAAQTFLAVLRMFPTFVPAVEGLAQAYFLGGSPQAAAQVLQETRHFHFTPQARHRFLELEKLYAQQ